MNGIETNQIYPVGHFLKYAFLTVPNSRPYGWQKVSRDLLDL